MEENVRWCNKGFVGFVGFLEGFWWESWVIGVWISFLGCHSRWRLKIWLKFGTYYCVEIMCWFWCWCWWLVFCIGFGCWFLYWCFDELFCFLLFRLYAEPFACSFTILAIFVRLVQRLCFTLTIKIIHCHHPRISCMAWSLL